MAEFTLPYRGINKGAIVDKQPPATSGYMNNVRPRDVLENRLRIGQRPGLDKWGDGDRIGGASFPIVAICSITIID